MSIVGILCYYWLNIVATSESQVKYQEHNSLTYSATLGTTWLRGSLQQRQAHVVSWEAEFPTLTVFISSLREINCRNKWLALLQSQLDGSIVRWEVNYDLPGCWNIFNQGFRSLIKFQMPKIWEQCLNHMIFNFWYDFVLFCCFFSLLFPKVLGNFGWPRYLSSCSSWLHILFARLFLWRVFTKVSTTFIILFSFINQRYYLICSSCEKSPAEAWLWHHRSFLDFPSQAVSVYTPCVYCCSFLEGCQCVLFPFGNGDLCREQATFYSHGFPESEVTITSRTNPHFLHKHGHTAAFSWCTSLWFFPS